MTLTIWHIFGLMASASNDDELAFWFRLLLWLMWRERQRQRELARVRMEAEDLKRRKSRQLEHDLETARSRRQTTESGYSR